MNKRRCGMLANETIIKTVPKEQRCTQLQVIHDIGFVKIPKKLQWPHT